MEIRTLWGENSPSHLALLDASPLWDGAFGIAGKFLAKVQSFRVRQEAPSPRELAKPSGFD